MFIGWVMFIGWIVAVLPRTDIWWAGIRISRCRTSSVYTTMIFCKCDMKLCNIDTISWEVIAKTNKKQNYVETASLTWSKMRRVPCTMLLKTKGSGGKLVIKSKKLFPQNHMVHMISCARAATDRGLVSTAIQENVPQPTLQDLLPSLKNANNIILKSFHILTYRPTTILYFPIDCFCIMNEIHNNLWWINTIFSLNN